MAVASNRSNLYIGHAVASNRSNLYIGHDPETGEIVVHVGPTRLEMISGIEIDDMDGQRTEKATITVLLPNYGLPEGV